MKNKHWHDDEIEVLLHLIEYHGTDFWTISHIM